MYCLRVTHACMITVDCVCIADVYGMYRILSRVIVLTEFLTSLLFFSSMLFGVVSRSQTSSRFSSRFSFCTGVGKKIGSGYA